MQLLFKLRFGQTGCFEVTGKVQAFSCEVEKLFIFGAEELILFTIRKRLFNEISLYFSFERRCSTFLRASSSARLSRAMVL